jgi:hypothetical protein
MPKFLTRVNIKALLNLLLFYNFFYEQIILETPNKLFGFCFGLLKVAGFENNISSFNSKQN